MIQEEKSKIISNDYADFLIEYNRNPILLERYPNAVTHQLNTRFAIAYAPASQLNSTFISKYGYISLLRCYGLTSEKSLEASGINRLRTFPTLNLRGNGVLIAIIDTGIDYTNPIFIREDGTTKITALWDQTIDSENQYPERTFYGTEYTKEQINMALSSEDPFSVVPSTDTIGHGTMLAGIIVGSEVPEKSFSGVVPEAELIVVKLKQAKQVLRDFYKIPSDIPCYQENDILWALEYLNDISQKLGQPMAICLGLGTSQGSHDGRGALDNLIRVYGDIPGNTATIAVGNEGAAKRHFYSVIDKEIGYAQMELHVGENEFGFSLEIWGTVPNTYSIALVSPSGEYISRISESLRLTQEIRFIFETTVIYLDYQLIETHSGDQLILLRFQNPAPGIWKFHIYTRGDLTGSVHSWLPMNGFITDDTYFIQSDPYTTVLSPANAFSPIAVTAYNPDNDSLYLEASRGYTRTGEIKPKLAAPGVNIIIPTLNHGFTTASGTGIAAAHTAGITAILLEWGLVRGFYQGIDSVEIKKYLIRGAARNPKIQYPNPNWGYGIIDIYNVFDVFRRAFPGQV